MVAVRTAAIGMAPAGPAANQVPERRGSKAPGTAKPSKKLATWSTGAARAADVEAWYRRFKAGDKRRQAPRGAALGGSRRTLRGALRPGARRVIRRYPRGPPTPWHRELDQRRRSPRPRGAERPRRRYTAERCNEGNPDEEGDGLDPVDRYINTLQNSRQGKHQ
jgi:hypothetical protein